MPWTPQDAAKHTHLAQTAAQRRQWADAANGVLARTGDDATAIEQANGVLKAHPSQKKDHPGGLAIASARRKK